MVKHTEYAIISGMVFPLDTDTQQKIASRELSRVGINSTRIWRNGIGTNRLLLADTNVDPTENGCS
jgi:hypothetical protein